MDRIMLVGLLKIELPGKTVRLCDGGFVVWGSETFTSDDSDFGTIGALESFTEGVGDEIPGGRLTFLPKSTAAVADLSAPGMQGSRMRFWVAEINEATGAIIGTPDLQADVQTDRTVVKIGKSTRSLEMDFVSTAERLFVRNEGNTLSSGFHKSIWPGETGEDLATGLGVSVAWGVESAPRGSTYSLPISPFSGAFGGGNYVNYV